MEQTANAIVAMNQYLPQLKGVDKEIATFMLENSNKIITSTIAQLALEIGVAESSIMRFCKLLGFKGFTAFKINIAQHTSTITKAPLNSSHDSLQEETEEMLSSKIFDKTIQNLSITQKMINHQDISKVAQLILKSDKVLFLGVSTSAYIAKDTAYRFLHMGINVNSATDPYVLRFSANQLTENSLAIAISHSGKTMETINALKVAKEKGAKTISITSIYNSPITKISDISFVTSSTADNNVFADEITSRIPQYVLMECLIDLCILHLEQCNS